MAISRQRRGVFTALTRRGRRMEDRCSRRAGSSRAGRPGSDERARVSLTVFTRGDNRGISSASVRGAKREPAMTDATADSPRHSSRPAIRLRLRRSRHAGGSEIARTAQVDGCPGGPPCSGPALRAGELGFSSSPGALRVSSSSRRAAKIMLYRASGEICVLTTLPTCCRQLQTAEAFGREGSQAGSSSFRRCWATRRLQPRARSPLARVHWPSSCIEITVLHALRAARCARSARSAGTDGGAHAA